MHAGQSAATHPARAALHIPGAATTRGSGHTLATRVARLVAREEQGGRREGRSRRTELHSSLSSPSSFQWTTFARDRQSRALIRTRRRSSSSVRRWAEAEAQGRRPGAWRRRPRRRASEEPVSTPGSSGQGAERRLRAWRARARMPHRRPRQGSAPAEASDAAVWAGGGGGIPAPCFVGEDAAAAARSTVTAAGTAAWAEPRTRVRTVVKEQARHQRQSDRGHPDGDGRAVRARIPRGPLRPPTPWACPARRPTAAAGAGRRGRRRPCGCCRGGGPDDIAVTRSICGCSAASTRSRSAAAAIAIR